MGSVFIDQYRLIQGLMVKNIFLSLSKIYFHISLQKNLNKKRQTCDNTENYATKINITIISSFTLFLLIFIYMQIMKRLFWMQINVDSTLLQYQEMGAFKQFILECDFFAHGSLQRYKSKQVYGTIAGGIVSIALIIFLIAVFFNLVMQTFQRNTIFATTKTSKSNDPSYSLMETRSATNLMFAVGITDIDLSSSIRYFDISFVYKTQISNNGRLVSKVSNTIPLTPCNISQWSGVSPTVTSGYNELYLDKYLCPPIGVSFPLQGRSRSSIYKYGQITVTKCTLNDTKYPNTTCVDEDVFDQLLEQEGEFYLNYVFINPMINPADTSPIDYYIEDGNTVTFDTYSGVSANLFHSDYTMNTDYSILPWTDIKVISGLSVQSTASTQYYNIQKNNNQFLQFKLRKDSKSVQYDRTFQKLDMTLAYVGGLFGSIVLALLILKVYSKFSYELNLGDHIFKQQNGGTFGSENFNFLAFMGYLVFLVCDMLNINLNWKTMKNYHRCITQCNKQLNIDLLLRKISHFEQVTKIILEDHHLKMLFMFQKPTIKEIRLNRKRYMLNSIIYRQIQRKSHEINIDQSVFKDRLDQFLGEDKPDDLNEIIDKELSNDPMKDIRDELKASFKKIQSAEECQSPSSKKILKKLSVVDEMAFAVLNLMQPSFLFPQKIQQNQKEDEQFYYLGDSTKKIDFQIGQSNHHLFQQVQEPSSSNNLNSIQDRNVNVIKQERVKGSRLRVLPTLPKVPQQFD